MDRLAFDLSYLYAHVPESDAHTLEHFRFCQCFDFAAKRRVRDAKSKRNAELIGVKFKAIMRCARALCVIVI
jgi:hypothetical protein